MKGFYFSEENRQKDVSFKSDPCFLGEAELKAAKAFLMLSFAFLAALRLKPFELILNKQVIGHYLLKG